MVAAVHGHGAESVIVPPSATEPPPVRPLPAVTVREELASWLLPMVEVETNDVPLYERSCPPVNELAPVPPLAIGRAV